MTRSFAFANDEHTKSAVLINKKWYNVAILPKLLRYMDNDKGLRSINIIKEQKDISRYSNDGKIGQLIAIKVSRKLARKIKMAYPEFVND